MNMLSDSVNSIGKGFVLCAQANCHNRPQAMIELVTYINSAMKNYSLDSENDYIVNRRRKNCRQRKNRKNGQQKGSSLAPNLNKTCRSRTKAWARRLG